MPYRKTASFRFDSILSVLLLIAILVGLFYLVKGVFLVLSVIAPVLGIAAFFIDRSVIINYGKWIFSTLKSNPLLGVGAILFTVLGYMVVLPFLFAKALMKKKFKDARQQYEQEQQGELIDFEELDTRRNDRPLELPRFEKEEKQARKSEYDKLFD